MYPKCTERIKVSSQIIQLYMFKKNPKEKHKDKNLLNKFWNALRHETTQKSLFLHPLETATED